MATVSVRYIVNDVDRAIAFYRDMLGFTEVMHPAPAFAMLSRGDLRLVLSAPGGGRAAARRCPTARSPSPAAGTGSRSRSLTWRRWLPGYGPGGVRFRNEIVNGVGGRQILAEDPSGNLVELFEPVIPEARLSPP